MIEVRNKDELRKAIDNEVDEFIVVGKFAQDIKKVKVIAGWTSGMVVAVTAMLGIAVFAAPVTGGLSFFAAVPVAALTGTEIGIIILASTIGIAILITTFKDYDMDIKVCDKIRFKRKRNK